MNTINDSVEEKMNLLLRRAIDAVHQHNWLVWNPSQQGKLTIFDLASVPPKGNGSDEWDDDKMMVYKAITEENMTDIGMCLDEAKHYKAMPVFIVESRQMAEKIAKLAGHSEDKRWTLMVPGDSLPQKQERESPIDRIGKILAKYTSLDRLVK